MNRSELIQILGRIQNSVGFERVDIVTITGCVTATGDVMSAAEVEAHVLRNFARLSDARKREVLDFTRDLKAAAA